LSGKSYRLRKRERAYHTRRDDGNSSFPSREKETLKEKGREKGGIVMFSLMYLW